MSCKTNHKLIENNLYCPECGIKVININRSDMKPEEYAIDLSSRVIRLADILSKTVLVLGGLSLLTGFILCIYTTHTDHSSESSYGITDSWTETSHPFLTLGIVIAFSGLFQAMILNLFFQYIEMSARFKNLKYGPKGR